jgi:hypothetical protein
MAVLVTGKNVDAYVPNGSWQETGSLNVQLVPIEGSDARATISTKNAVNSCSSNSATGETVCTANTSDVYLITGAALTKTLTSGATGTASFSGGTCKNCGVVVDSTSNRAWLVVGTATGPGAYQSLNLADDSFAKPILSAKGPSEDIAVDPNRHLLLSPDEAGFYEIVQSEPPNSLFLNFVVPHLDSGAEDCTTGIALSSIEFSNKLFLADLSRATFTTGSPGSWTAPSQIQTFPEFSKLSAGTSGIAVAPNTHIGVVIGEFGGNVFAAIQLPSTTGSGTPAVTDWAVATIPNEPHGGTFMMGLDPHTMTVFNSPSSGKAFALIGDDPRAFVAVVDLQALLAAPRTAGTHNVDPSFNLVSNGVVRFVSIF